MTNTTLMPLDDNSNPINKTTQAQWQCVLGAKDIALIVCYFILFIVGTVGNILVIISFRTSRKRGSTIDLLILYLAFFDLLASIFTPYLFGYWIWTCNKRWDFGWFGCKIIPFATRIFTSVSIGILLIMAIDRYRVIVTPLKLRFQPVHIHISVGITVLLACLSELHYITTLTLEKNSLNQTECAAIGTDFYNYALIAITLFRDTAFVVIFSFTTISVIYHLYHVQQQIVRSLSNRSVSQRKRRRVFKMMVVIATVFGITVIPRDLFHISLIIEYAFFKKQIYTETVLLINNILKLLQTSNSVYNVFVYAGMSDSFCRNIISFSKSVKRKLRRNYGIKKRGSDIDENGSLLRRKTTTSFITERASATL